MKYSTGEKIRIGYSVLIENRNTKGRIFALSKTMEEAEKWGLNEIGVTIESEPFGLVFYPIPDEIDSIEFISRIK